MKNLKYICNVFFIITIIALASCSASNSTLNPTSDYKHEDLVDRLHEAKLPPAIEEIDYGFKREVGIDALDNQKYPKDVDSLSEFIIDEDFYNAYIEKYGILDLLEHFNTYLICAEDPDEVNPNDYTKDYVTEINNRDSMVHRALYDLQAYKDIETIPFNGKEIINSGNDTGYYSDYEDTKEEGTVSGEFNDAKNDNEIYTESRGYEKETNYYGDWKIVHDKGASYDEGSLGYVEGVYVDEPAHWNHYDLYHIYHCDEEWCTISDADIEDINIEFKIIDNKLFYFQYDNYEKTEIIKWKETSYGTSSSSESDEIFSDEAVSLMESSIKKGLLPGNVKWGEKYEAVVKDLESIAGDSIELVPDYKTIYIYDFDLFGYKADFDYSCSVMSKEDALSLINIRVDADNEKDACEEILKELSNTFGEPETEDSDTVKEYIWETSDTRIKLRLSENVGVSVEYKMQD